MVKGNIHFEEAVISWCNVLQNSIIIKYCSAAEVSWSEKCYPKKCHIIMILTVFTSKNDNFNAKMIIPTNHKYYNICPNNYNMIFDHMGLPYIPVNCSYLLCVKHIEPTRYEMCHTNKFDLLLFI